MTKNEVMALAKQAAFHTPVMEGELLRFAALVAAHEREACARVAETLALDDLGSTDDWPDAIADAIRSRT